MDCNTRQCNNTTQFANEKIEYKIGDLERWEKSINRWINIMCGCLQGDSYSLAGFCIPEIPVNEIPDNQERQA